MKMQTTLEARLLIAALVCTLIWAITPRPSIFSSTWIEPGTPLVEHETFPR
jgi:hypothetical protein